VLSMVQLSSLSPKMFDDNGYIILTTSSAQ
jgi:hypothetical protein